MHEIDINALLSAVAGGAGVYAAIKVKLALLEYKYSVLRRDFEAHIKKAGH
jgi:hypothetical protein